eukprot:1554778-Rhodomonas_salina.1
MSININAMSLLWCYSPPSSYAMSTSNHGTDYALPTRCPVCSYSTDYALPTQCPVCSYQVHSAHRLRGLLPRLPLLPRVVSSPICLRQRYGVPGTNFDRATGCPVLT